jgi:hypothetical protein
MRQGAIVDLFPLLPQLFHNVVDFDGIPIQDGIR